MISEAAFKIQEDLAALAPDIESLAGAWSTAAHKQLNKNTLKNIETNALALQVPAIEEGIFALQAANAASFTREETYKEMQSSNPDFENTKVEESRKIEEEKEYSSKHFDYDCDIVGADEWWDPDAKWYDKERKAVAPLKVSNPFKIKMRVQPLLSLEEWWAEQSGTGGNTASQCFNCNLDIKIDSMYPGIEFAWEFSKLAKMLEEMLKHIKKNLDPTLIYSQICNLKMFWGKNLICPATLKNIQYMLPALFAKYSLDLMNLSASSSWLLGGVVKALFTAVATMLENLRALLIPFLDCTINALKATLGYVKAVASTIAQAADTVVDVLDRAHSSFEKAIQTLMETFTAKGDLAENRIAKDEVIQRLKKELKALLKAKAKLEAKSRGNYFYEHAAEELQKKDKKNLAEIDTLISKINFLRLINDDDKVFYYVDTNRARFDSFNFNIFQTLVTEYYAMNGLTLEEAFQEEGEGRLSGLEEERAKIASSKYYTLDPNELDGKAYTKGVKDLYERRRRERNKVHNNIKIANDAIESKQEQLRQLTESLEYKMSSRDSSFRERSVFNRTENEGGADALSKSNVSPRYNEPSALKRGAKSAANSLDEERVKRDKLRSFLKDRYSVDIKNEYVTHENDWAKSVRSFGQDISKVGGMAEDFFVDWIIGPVENLKLFINDTFGNVINLLKSFNLLFDQNTFARIKILGEILQVVHLFRVYNIIRKMLDDGLKCEDLETKAQTKEALKQMLEDNTSEEYSLTETSEFGDQLSSQEEFKIISKDNRYSHVLNLSDCSDISKHIFVNEDSLDRIYDAMKQGSF